MKLDDSFLFAFPFNELPKPKGASMMKRYFFATLLACLPISQLLAQTPFFKTSPRDSQPLRSEIYGVTEEFEVAVDVRALAATRSRRDRFVVLNSDGRDLTFKQIQFDPQSGFVLTDDLQDIIPDPRGDLKSLSYAWMGLSGNQTLTFTVHQGIISGTLIGDRGSNYQLAPTKNGIRWQAFDNRKIGAMDPPYAPEGRTELPRGRVVTLSPKPNTPQHLDTVKILVLHTPQALAGAGGQANLNATVTQAINDLNITFRNSGIVNIQVENVSDQLSAGNSTFQVSPDFDETEPPPTPNPCTVGADACRWIRYRHFLRSDLPMLIARNLIRADVVMLVVNQVGTGPTPILGIAYIQKPDCANQFNFGDFAPGCGIGDNYFNFAFAAVALNQMNVWRTFSHEVGHQFGMEHESSSGTPSFTWSFARSVPGVAESVMATNGYGSGANPTVKRLQFSNPYIDFLGTTTPSGTAINPATPTRYNALTAQSLGPLMSNFYDGTLPDVVFRSDFEEVDNYRCQ